MGQRRTALSFVAQVLSNLQNARLFVLSYPLYPDPLAIANVVLEEQQQFAADEALCD